MTNQLRSVLVITVLGLIVHGLLLIDPSAFWDDYFILNSSFESIFQLYKLSGIYIAPYVYIPIKWGGSIWFFKFFTFVFSIGSSLILYKTLLNLKLSNEDSLTASLISLSFPLMFARISIIHVPYIGCLMASITAFYFLTLFMQSSKQRDLILSLIFFWLSCYIIVFFMFDCVLLVILACWYYFKVPQLKKKTNTAIFFSYGILFLHFIHWLIFCRPTGIYQSYNRPVLDYLNRPGVFIDLMKVLYSLVEYNFLSSYFQISILILTIAYAIISIYKKKSLPKSELLTMAISVVVIIIFCLPYILIDKIPRYQSFSSRHQLTFFIPVTFFIFSFLRVIKISHMRRLFTILMVISFTASWLSFYISSQHDYHLLNSFKLNIRNDFPLCRNISLNLEDSSLINKRYYTFTELSGLFNFTNNKNDYFVSSDYESDYSTNKESFTDIKVIFAMSDAYLKEQPDCSIKVEGITFNSIETVKLSFQYFLDKDQYNSKIRDLSKISELNAVITN